MMERYNLPLKRTPYVISLDGYIYNANTARRLKPQKTASGTVSTRIYYPPQIETSTYYGKIRHKREFKVVSNARLMINTFFSIGFKYKILYKDGDKTNCAIENLVIKQTIKRGTHYYDGLKVDLVEFLPIIESRIGIDPYEKILLSID